MKTIIAGSRNITDMKLLEEAISKSLFKITEVVCGGARGPDTLGKEWAVKNNIPVKEFPADWNTHGKSAGFIRNKQMGDYAEALIALWEGESRGTQQIIRYTSSLRKPVFFLSLKEKCHHFKQGGLCQVLQ